MRTVEYFCHRKVIVCSRTETVRDAALRMRDHHVGSVVVVDEKTRNARPVGIITDRDVAIAVVAAGKDPATLPVSEVMAPKLVIAQNDEGIDEVLRRMRAFGIRRIPVVDAHGSLQGLVALDDLLAHVAAEMAEMATLLHREQAHEREREHTG